MDPNDDHTMDTDERTDRITGLPTNIPLQRPTNASLSMQDQIHELAKTLPPPRKQNIACDACRTRKVKCHVKPGEDRCQHCKSKNYPCTHYVQEATNAKRRASVTRRPRRTSDAATSSAAQGPPTRFSPPSAGISNNNALSVPANGGIAALHNVAVAHLQQNNSQPAVTPLQTPTQYLLSYLFSPEHSMQNVMPSFVGSPAGSQYRATKEAQSPNSGKISRDEWGEVGRRLDDDAFRIELALDLVEVFFQICHTRLPLLNPTQFRERLHQSLPGSTSGSSRMSSAASATSSPRSSPGASSPHMSHHPRSLHPALLATVLAWGAKFSEHPLLVLDRGLNNGRSKLARTLLRKAREVAEAEKIHRVPTAENVVIALLIEPLQTRANSYVLYTQLFDLSSDFADDPRDLDGFHGFWTSSAIRHLFSLQINHKSIMSAIQDPDVRGTMIFAWWMACLADAYASAYFRRKPLMDDDDYDIDFYTVDGEVYSSAQTTAPEEQTPDVSRVQLEFLGWYAAAHAMARITRQMSKQLWRPTTEADGISFDVLCQLMALLNRWKEEHLPKVGVPSDFEAEWDFVAAVSACASDATYHVMWCILWDAVDDFGVREVNEVIRSGDSPQSVKSGVQIDAVRQKLLDEALHSALRIAGLASVLGSNNYLRLDPNVMHYSIYVSGMLLAKLGRPEVQHCIAGLEQYGYAYEEAFDQAADMKRKYQQALASGQPHSPLQPSSSFASASDRLSSLVRSSSNAMSVDGASYSSSVTTSPEQHMTGLHSPPAVQPNFSPLSYSRS